MKKSTVSLPCAIFWGAGALAWLPGRTTAIVDLPGLIFSTLCAAAFVRQLLQYFRNRKTENKGKLGGPAHEFENNRAV